MKVVESREAAAEKNKGASDAAETGKGETEDTEENSSSTPLDLSVTADALGGLVGKPPFTSDRLYEGPLPVGTVTGLAWTAMGGSVLYMEASALPKVGGKAATPSLSLTGQLGDVMKESSQLALLIARRHINRLQLPERKAFFEENDIHIHCPEGATPKDGPSAGVTMVTALLSLGLDVPARVDLAMTGEVSLNGKVLPIGGVKEKTIAARRAGCKALVFPQANRRDFEELPEYLREGIDVHYASHYDDVFAVAFPDVCTSAANATAAVAES
jgi:Lon-like ATP-dependent protease